MSVVLFPLAARPKTLRETPRRQSFGDWMIAHDLNLVVREREAPAGDPQRFYARFEGEFTDPWIKQESVLISALGFGSTPAKAVTAYKRRIEGRTLVFDVYKENRRTIICPLFR